MDTELDISRLLTLRKVTRGISDLLGGMLTNHLRTLGPLFQPRALLGEYVRGTTKQSVKGEEEAIQRIKTLYATVAPRAPFNLRKEIETPLDVVSNILELAPAEYSHQADTGREKKTIVVATPLKWVLSYSGFGIPRMREFLALQGASSGNDLYQAILHHLVLHVIFAQRPGLVALLEAMRFRVTSIQYEGLGQLPITVLEAPLSTVRPSDEVVIQSTEISGTGSFAEVVDPRAIDEMPDPMRVQLQDIVRSFQLPSG